MNKLQKKMGNLIQRIIDSAMGNGLMQEETTAEGERYVTPGGMGHMARKYKSDGSLLKTLGQPDGITRGELQRTAKNVLNLVLKLKY